MCVAIFKPAGKQVSKTDMQRAHVHNKDGSGFAIRHSKGIYVDKGVWTFEQFWQRFEPYKDFEALIHFRWSTAGGISDSMCHPFHVGNGAMIHNGHIAGYGSKTQSDTLQWCEDVLHPIIRDNPALISNRAFQQLLADSIGTRNKIIVMLPGIPTAIIGTGITEDGIWYSNLDYRHVRQYTMFPKKSTEPSPAAACYYGENEESAEYDLAERDNPYSIACEACHNDMDLEYSVCQECYDFLGDMQAWNEQGKR